MRLKQIVLTIFLFYMLVFLRTSIINGNTAILDTNAVSTGIFGTPKIGEEVETIEDYELLTNIQPELEEQITINSDGNSLEDSLNDFNPNMNLTGDYAGESFEGSFEDVNSSITLPGNGQFSLEGNVTNLQSQYITNPGAETDQMFYSENANIDNYSDGAGITGLEFQKTQYPGSWNGDYVWKYSVNDAVPNLAVNYWEDIPFYDTNIKISYKYLLTSNSSLQDVVNSSLYFDFEFDKCRIKIYHWYYTDAEPPSIGANSTDGVFDLFHNSSWNNQWNEYTLDINDLISENSTFRPTTLNYFGIFVKSPEVSDYTVLFDDLKVESALMPTDIDLRLNDIQVSSVGLGGGVFDEEILFDSGEPYEYEINWYHNSSYSISANYTIIKSAGIISIPYTKQIIFENETSILISINIYNLSMLVDPINFTHPDTWLIAGTPQGVNVLSNTSIEEGYRLLQLSRIAGIYDIEFRFILPNQILALNIENITVFETLNVTISFLEILQNNQIEVFWFGATNGSKASEVIDDKIEFTFPPEIASGSYSVTFLIIEDNLIGYRNSTITITRASSDIIVNQEISIPRYAMEELVVSYICLNHLIEIEDANVTGILDGEILPNIRMGDQYVFRISSFYLSGDNYTLDIVAQSSSHASVQKTVNVSIYESEIDIDFEYEVMEISSDFLLQFNVTSDNLPVGLVPITIEINEYGAHSGITNEQGIYTYVIALPQNLLIVDINCSIFKAITPIASETFQIILENLLATTERSSEDVIIADNITLSYDITYPSSHDRWKHYIDEDMMPILEVYVETSTLQIPVYADSEAFYWHIQADANANDHKLKIVTVGPNIQTTIEENDTQISIHFIINSDIRSYSDISILYYLNESYSTSKYDWILLSSNENDVTSLYELQVNDLYVYATNLEIAKGSILILDLVGTKTSNAKSITNIVVPLVSSSGVLLGAVTAILKVYNKKKGMVLDI